MRAFVSAMSRATAVIGLSAAVIGLAPAWAGAMPAAAGTASKVSADDVLVAVAASSRTSAWAVGDSHDAGGAEQTLIEHWNGRAWRIMPTPDPGGAAADNEIDGIAATSTSSAWAVGQYWNGSNWHTQILRWNGRSWKRVTCPNPGGVAGRNILDAVAATSRTNAWAVGDYSAGSTDRTLILHWNGRAWRQVASPHPGGTGGSTLNAVAAVSSANAWAAGEYWNGTDDKTLIEHWNGRSWKLVPSPNPGTAAGLDEFSGIAASSRSSALAVGDYYATYTTQHKTLAERWNGRSWKSVASPNPDASGTYNVLSAVTTTSSTSAWAVGAYLAGGNNRPLIEHWNGKSWHQVGSPFPASATRGLLVGVAAVTTSGRAWAVGYYHVSPGTTLTLIDHWNGRSWQRVPSPNR
jgi:hypothetical protein